MQVFRFSLWSVPLTTFYNDCLSPGLQTHRDKFVGDITVDDLKYILNHWIELRYAYTTAKSIYIDE